MNGIAIPLQQGGSFTEAQAEYNKKLVHPEAFPHLYGDRLFKPLKLVDRCKLVDVKDIKETIPGETDVNTAWAKDGNDKFAQIRTSIESFGLRLIHPPIALYTPQSTSVSLKANGTTRNKILGMWEYTNRICDIYEGDHDNYSQDQIDDARAKFSQSSNLQGYDPHGTTDNEDLVQGCLFAIQCGWIHKDDNGVPLETGPHSVTARIDDICGNYKLTQKPKEILVARIVAQTDEVLTGKRFWASSGDVERFIVSGKGGMNFVSINPKYDNNGNLISRGIIYVVFETSEYRRCLPAATATADANPDSDVRVILYKQYIKAQDAATNYMETLDSVKNYWDSQLAKYSTVHFNGAKVRRGNCHIYGAVPSLRSLHDLDELVFLKPNGEWEQK